PVPASSADPHASAHSEEAAQAQDVGVAHTDAAVGDPPGDEPGLVGAVDADHAALRPVGEARRVGARPEGERPIVAARAGDPAALADVEVPRGSRGAGLADPDWGAEDLGGAAEEGRAELAPGDDQPLAHRVLGAEDVLADPAEPAVRATGDIQ